MALAKFASIPINYAPKRKFLEFAKPKFHNKLGEFSDPDVLSWITRLYQDKAFKTPKDFNEAYDAARNAGLMPSKGVAWANRTMVLTKEDVDNFIEEFDGGAFCDSETAARKLVTKMKALEGKVVFVY